MDFCILGPLEVLDRGRPVGLGGRKQRALLALLLLHAGEAVSTDRLVDELWGERPPATAAKLVQGYVAALRKLLPDGVLVTRPPGYLLGLDGAAHSLDLRRFETLVAEAKDAAPERAVGLFREALALWRGPALGDVSFGGLAASEARRSERLAAGRAHAADRARTRPGPSCRSRRRARELGGRAPVPGAAARPTDPRPLPLGQTGRGARGVPGCPPRARRARDRAERRT